MEKAIEFIGNNYAWFLTVSIILLFALIGYITDSRRSKNDLMKKSEDEIDEDALANLVVPEGKSLGDMVSKSKNFNRETQSVELDDKSILGTDKEEKVVTPPMAGVNTSQPETLDTNPNK